MITSHPCIFICLDEYDDYHVVSTRNFLTSLLLYHDNGVLYELLEVEFYPGIDDTDELLAFQQNKINNMRDDKLPLATDDVLEAEYYNHYAAIYDWELMHEEKELQKDRT